MDCSSERVDDLADGSFGACSVSVLLNVRDLAPITLRDIESELRKQGSLSERNSFITVLPSM